MMPSATTAPVDASQLSDHDLYESFRDRGLSHAAAVLHIERRRRAANQPVETVPATPGTSPLEAAIMGAGRTATSGFQDEIIGAMRAMSGDYGHQPSSQLFDPAVYAQGRDQLRAQQQQTLVEHPGVSLGAGFLGAQVNPLNYLLRPLTAFMTPGQTGATYGATLGAAQGAGEGESGLGRVTGAAGGAVGGALIGGTLGYVGGKLNQYTQNLWKGVQPLFQRTAKNIAASVAKDAPEEVVNGLTETSVRAQLAKQGFKPQDIDNAVALWKNGGKPPAPAPPPPTVRPGETITPTENLDKATFLRRGGTVRQDTSPLSGNRSMSFDPGKGQTLPWYPRGGQVEQSMAPPPASAPAAAAPNQTGAFLNYLKQAASPQDALARLGTIRDLGIQISPEDQTQMLQLLFGAQR